MSGGLPGLAGTDHVGFTVPEIEAATRFFDWLLTRFRNRTVLLG